MDALKQAFYDVMYKYEASFSEKGVAANLNLWRQAKGPLVDVLRQHPNWNEQELAIVFEVSEHRGIDRDTVDETKYDLMLFSEKIAMTPEERSDFKAAINETTADHARVPDESRLMEIARRGHIKCAPGQKASRIINKICLHFGLDHYEEDKVIAGEPRRVKPYNAIFARLADALNPAEIQKTAVLSVHPCDFLEMSNKDDVWHSCHCLGDGCYKGGCQSYMGDGVSMIFFTIDESVRADFHKAPRITREIFCYTEGLLLQSRLYPTDNAEQYDLYRNLVQRAISECLGAPNLWTTRRELKNISDFWTTASGALHYTDYDNGYASLSFLKGGEPYGHLRIGSQSLCPCCGEPINNHRHIKCDHCEKVVICKDCGETVRKCDTHYLEGAFYCKACVHRCSFCGEYTHGTVYPAFDEMGTLREVCAPCHNDIVEPCSRCAIQTVCAVLRGGQFCPHTAIRAVAG